MSVTWDPEKVLYAEVTQRMKRMGLHPSSAIFLNLLQKMKKADNTFEVHFDKVIVQKEEILIEAAIEWFVDRLMSTPDGIDSLVEGEKSNRQSAMYNAALESMRTSKGQLFTAEQIAARLKITLSQQQQERRRQLRQLRRLLVRICTLEGGYIKRVNKAEVLYGFR